MNFAVLDRKRQMFILTCLKSKVKMYEKMECVDRAIPDSTWSCEECTR
jgi:hypothetical protein